MSRRITILALAILLLASCGSSPTRTGKPSVTAQPDGGYLAGDGPGEDAPANIDAIPDAVPRNESLHRYANRPYVALGKTYAPLTSTNNFKQRGIASWYGKKFHGERTSSGEVYDMYAMTAAHPTLPIPSYARVTNPANQKSVIVRINDRGPFLHDRVIDLSYTAAHKLGIIGGGSAEVEVESIVATNSMSSIARTQVESRQLESSTLVSAALPPVTIVPSLESRDTGVFLQLGAFESQENAVAFLEKIRGELGANSKQLKLFHKDGLVRVHIGPYANQSEARSNAESLEDKLGFKPLLSLP